ncbi:hypothetical protein JYK14_16810 [Siccirubricoccus sp. KC 17139]|uniref:Uncharacterized protein n=1 Tax=Siccirubricoccus soli TaxID=2899147 RepID=A0ABT1D7C3_9PROT|nr:hypothetical protein [Siccirubricoccus soli]MCO6417811.1 hypothetical protein [Siccirubricoccus soli]MCP2683946.1 hypothetical protein [Siccirubricoccus soli]
MCRLALLLPGLLLGFVLLAATRTGTDAPPARPSNWANTQQLSAPLTRPPVQNWATPSR